MTRTEDDTWDLASSVGATATMVAAARAAATKRPQPVINDPFAEPLVRAVGIEVFTRLAAGELDSTLTMPGWAFPRMTDTFAARARFYDDYFAQVTDAGVRQVVIVAAGLDSRAYRLSWPAGTTVYEIDQPEVIEFKTSTLSKIGAAPTTEHRAVGIDLREDWPAALRAAGFDPAQPTAWLAEGVLIGLLPPEAEIAAAGQHDFAERRRQPAGRRLWIGHRNIDGIAGTGAADDRGLATARIGLGHRRFDLPRRTHRRRRIPASARVGRDQVPAR